MTKSLEELEAIVRNRVCSVCSDRTVDGTCGREEPSDCALFRLFPQVAGAILATESADIRDYIQAIRKHVCAVCVEQASDESCEVREQVRCALDAYLMLVVEAIEEATGKSFDRTVLSPAGSDPTVRLPAG